MKRSVFYSFILALGLGFGTAAHADGHRVTQAELDAALDCPSSPRDSDRLVCACVAGSATGSIWGSGPYTGDSATCNAAAHAGALEAGVGMVVVIPRGPQDSFEGSTENGIRTSNWGSYSSSFDVVAARLHKVQVEIDTPTFSADEVANAQACPVNLPIDQDVLLCSCPADAAARSVWGTGLFTGDSDICTAARHSGATGDAGGMVVVMAAEGQDSYEGSEANGVTTRDWRSYGRSIMVSNAVMPTGEMSTLAACERLPSGEDRHSCSCPPNASPTGRIWGSSPYTADSDICTAALHAGAIGDMGGDVTVMRVDGLESYTASNFNGVQSSAWGGFSDSIVFDHNTADH